MRGVVDPAVKVVAVYTAGADGGKCGGGGSWGESGTLVDLVGGEGGGVGSCAETTEVCQLRQ